MTETGLSPIGSRAFIYQVACPFDLDHQRRIWAMADEVATWDDVAEAVPGMTNIFLRLNHVPLMAEALEQRLDRLWQSGCSRDLTGKILDIDITYGGSGGPHLMEVAELTGFTVSEVIQRHAAPLYTVYAVGSHAGYCYLGGLDPTLETPRRKVPLQSLPGGSLSMAGLQTGVSASAGPSGWNTIGAANVQFFDPQRSPAALLAPGDQIRFRIAEVIA